MASNLYLLKYNNYINHVLKLESSIAAYTTYQVGYQSAVNFFRGDELTTSHVCNVDIQIHADYLIETETTSAGEIILSRWFIMDKTRTSNQQVRLSLRRDVIAENRAAIMSATGFIERGYVRPNNPLIFNPEGNTYNQIKKQEHLLKDGTGSAWIVGYLADNFLQGADQTVSVPGATDYTEIYTDAAAVVAAYPGTSLTEATEVPTTNISVSNMSFFANYYGPPDQANRFNFASGRSSTAAFGTVSTSLKFYTDDTQSILSIISANCPTDNAAVAAIVKDNGITEIPASKTGTVIRVGTSSSEYRYYKLTLKSQAAKSFENVSASASSEMYKLIAATAQAVLDEGLFTGSVTISIRPQYNYSQIYRNYEWLDVTTEIKATISGTVTKVETAPYYMFAIPYGDVRFFSGSAGYTSARSDALAIANSIVQKFNAYIYDLQILPYYPGGGLVGEAIDLKLISNNNYSLVTEDGVPKTFIYWCGNTTFSRVAYYDIPLESDVKVQSETQICRICSPNYASIYEFSAAKNGGVTKFNIDCTYKPWQPYIHVAPDWGGLYGEDFHDPRGLICSGDFSLDIATDEWALYQANNKNYQLMFDRKIQTMDMQHAQATTNQIISGVLGTISEGAKGFATGGIIGAAIGAGSAAAVSGVGLGQGLAARANERSEAFDMFNYELGNVQARPDTLTKVSALNANNKLFPVVEIYEATPEEVAALQQQITYRGARVGVVANISDFLSGKNCYIQARLIRININDEPHIAQAIKNELAAGIYWN